MKKHLKILENPYRVFWKGEELELDADYGSRLIFHHDDFLVKIDHEPDGRWYSRQTAREIEFWETLTEDRKHFAKILDYGRTTSGKYWLQQKRYFPDDDELELDTLQTLEGLIFKYQLWDISLDFIDGSGNWMVSKGEVLIYDFGGYTT